MRVQQLVVAGVFLCLLMLGLVGVALLRPMARPVPDTYQAVTGEIPARPVPDAREEALSPKEIRDASPVPSPELDPPRADPAEPMLNYVPSERPPNIPNPITFAEGAAQAEAARAALEADTNGEDVAVLCVLQSQHMIQRWERIERWEDMGFQDAVDAFLKDPDLSWPDVVASCADPEPAAGIP